MAGMGPPPKPANNRRHSTPPKSWGGATPIEAPAAASGDRVLGIDNPHQLVESLWKVVQTSCEARFYSEADWARLRMELWNANCALTSSKPITGQTWATIQHGLNQMLISPAEKRRCAIDVRPTGGDPDSEAAVLQMVRYADKLQKPE